MMNQHEGIQCDVCVRNNFRGTRYKCLICSDFDLCSDCFERGLTSGSHLPKHPMQSILTRSDMTLFFGGEEVNSAKLQCLTCPYCGELGLTGKTLIKHLMNRHPNLNDEGASPVLCPICATRSNGNNNYTTTDLLGHLAVEHRMAVPRSLVERIDEATAATLRNPQPVPSTQAQAARRNNSSRSSRNSMDAVFLELMSHLPDVRFESRGGNGHVPGGGGGSSGGSSTSVQALQQIQLQLHQHQLDHPQPVPSTQAQVARRSNSSRSSRNSMGAVYLEMMSHVRGHVLGGNGGSSGGSSTSVQALQQLHQHQLDHRLARRAFSGQLPLDFIPTRESAPPPVAGPPNAPRGNTSGARSREAAALALQAAIASEARRYNSNGNNRRPAPNRGGSNDSIENLGGGAGDNIDTNIKSKSDTARAAAVKSEESDKFILKKFLRQDLSDYELAWRDHQRADRSLFVQALLLSAFSTNITTDVDGECVAAKENAEVTAISSKHELKEKRSKKKKNKRNKLKKQHEGVCAGEAVAVTGTGAATGEESGSNSVCVEKHSLEGACVGSSKT